MDVRLLDQLPAVGVAFDTETWLIKPKSVPPLVCASAAKGELAGYLLDRAQALHAFQRLLEPGHAIIGANIAFDMLVMATHAAKHGINLLPVIFAKYRRGEVYDVLLAEMLNAIGGGHLGKDPRTGGPIVDPSTGRQMSGYNPATGEWTGRYSLAVVLDHVCGRKDAKADDEWRQRYAELDGIPMDQWPATARKYPCDDAANTLEIALVQTGHLPGPDGVRRRSYNLHAVADIAIAAFALHVGATWGFAVDQDKVGEVEAEALATRAAGLARFQELGILRQDGSCDTAKLKRLVALAYGAHAPCPACVGQGCKECDKTGLDLAHEDARLVPRTPTRAVAKGRDLLVDSGDDDLAAYGEYGESAKAGGTYVPALRDGLPMRPNVPLANERVSYGGIVQTMPRNGAIREAVIARPGRVLSSVDFNGIELATLAQVCLWMPGVGWSDLAEAINSGKDPHCLLAADLCGRTYDEVKAGVKAGDKRLKDYRQAAKWGNFGFGGGMGPPKFVVTNRKAPGMTTKAPDGTVYKGVRFCLLVPGPDGHVAERCGAERVISWNDRDLDSPVCKRCIIVATQIREAWFGRWTEMRRYFKAVGSIVERQGYIEHFVSGVVRGGVIFTEAANGYFSSLAAIGAKRAFVSVQEACLTDPTSPLWGSRAIGFIHDEGVSEHPREVAHEASHEVARIMVAEMQAVVPDVVIRAAPALMPRFYKGAEEVFDEDGRLIPWLPPMKDEGPEAWLARVRAEARR